MGYILSVDITKNTEEQKYEYISIYVKVIYRCIAATNPLPFA